MTDNKDDKGNDAGDATSDAGNDSNDVEQKSLEMLKSISADLKSMNEKYDVVAKDNVALKEVQSEMKAELAKITEALKQPVHKSKGANENDADKKAAEGDLKSVDPIDLC